MIDVNKAIATTVKTGKILFGTNNAIKNAKTRRIKLIIVASNCPQKIREDIEYYCKLSNIPVTIYKGTSIDLGAVCGKPFKVSALTIREPGDSDILKLAEAGNG
jgi:large subunit ribosomal protein L30e